MTSAHRDIVLVIDDSPGSLGMVTDALEAAGITVLVALDGKAALDILGRITPDVILVDAVMPGMDGFETCRRIKAQPGLAYIPVIFMTGLTETAHILEGLEAGGVDYLTKPIVPDVLIARMRVHLANARSGQGARAALDAAGRHFVAVSPSGRIAWTTPTAARLLDAAGAVPGSLPNAVRDWLAMPRPAGEASKPLALPGGLTVTLVGPLGVGEVLLRLTEAQADNHAKRLRDSLGLTLREAEVLAWLAQGKSNRDIAAILGLSPRTVDKHLEQIYPKLGVENRASAAALATRSLSLA